MQSRLIENHLQGLIMQVIENVAMLAAIGGGDQKDKDKEKDVFDRLNCEIGFPDGLKCSGSARDFWEAAAAAYDAGAGVAKDVGGAIGIWVYDTLNPGSTTGN
jgi:hypothetical protein